MHNCNMLPCGSSRPHVWRFLNFSTVSMSELRATAFSHGKAIPDMWLTNSIWPQSQALNQSMILLAPIVATKFHKSVHTQWMTMGCFSMLQYASVLRMGLSLQWSSLNWTKCGRIAARKAVSTSSLNDLSFQQEFITKFAILGPCPSLVSSYRHCYAPSQYAWAFPEHKRLERGMEDLPVLVVVIWVVIRISKFEHRLCQVAPVTRQQSYPYPRSQHLCILNTFARAGHLMKVTVGKPSFRLCVGDRLSTWKR